MLSGYVTVGLVGCCWLNLLLLFAVVVLYVMLEVCFSVDIGFAFSTED